MPSPQFIKSYFSSFTDDIISQPLQKGEKKDEDKDKEGEAAEVTARSESRGLGIVSLWFPKMVVTSVQFSGSVTVGHCRAIAIMFSLVCWPFYLRYSCHILI